MWPAAFWEKLYEPLIRRAAGLGRAAGASRSGPLREGLRALRRAGDRRGPGRPDGGARGRPRRRARHPRATRTFASAGGCSRNAMRSTAEPGAEWARGVEAELAAMPEVRDPAAHHRVRRLRRRAHTARSSASAIMCPCRPRISRASGSGRSSQARRAGGRRHRAADRVRRQRPARRDAGRRGAHLRQSFRASAPGRALAVFTNNDDGWRTAADLQRAGVGDRSVVDARSNVAPRRCAALARHARGTRDDTHGGSAASDRRGRRGRPRGDDRRATRSPCRAAGIRRCISPAISAASPCGTRTSRPSCRATLPPGMTVAGAAQRRADAAALPRGDGARPARWRLRIAASTDPPIGPPPCRRRAARAIAPLWHVTESRAQGVRRFPERRDVDGHRARRARRLPLGRALEALHHARHGDRPGQDRERRRAWRSSPKLTGRAIPRVGTTTVPAALYAGRYRRVGRPPSRQGFPPDAPDRRRMRGRSEQGAVFVEAGEWLRAQ